jgi:hypothetical protein
MESLLAKRAANDLANLVDLEQEAVVTDSRGDDEERVGVGSMAY